MPDRDPTCTTAEPATLDPTRMIDIVDGAFGQTTAGQLAALVDGLAEQDTLVLHAHGGLVPRGAALRAIPHVSLALDDVAPVVHLIWNTGPWRAIWQAFTEAATEPFAAFCEALSDFEDRPDRNKSMDDAFADVELASFMHGRVDPDGVAHTPRVTDAVSEALAEARENPDKGLFDGFGTLLSLARFGLKILQAVRARRRDEPGRPLWPTVVEEAIRQLVVLEKPAQAVWAEMKEDATDIFATDEAPGSVLVEHLRGWWKEGRRLVLVGHSAGSVVGNALVRALAQRLPECRVDLVYLAAACTVDDLADLLVEHEDQIGSLHLVGLSDERERSYFEIPVLYRGSLLYLVSGLLEPRPGTPLVGMEWSYVPARHPGGVVPLGSRLILERHTQSPGPVWSPSEGPGRSSQGRTHGGLWTECSTLRGVRRALFEDADVREEFTDKSGDAPRTRGPTVDVWTSDAHTLAIERPVPQVQAGRDEGLLAASSTVDLTRELGRYTAGYSVGGAQRGKGWYGRIRATLCLLEDGEGQRALLVAADLLAGSRYLTEAIAAALADEGLSVDRVHLAASHTHCAQGCYFGNRFYDTFASGLEGFDKVGTTWAVERIVQAVRDMARRLAPARIGAATDVVWNHTWQRSLGANLANLGHVQVGSESDRADEALQVTTDRYGTPGTLLTDEDGTNPYGAPTFEALRRTRIDPRVHAIAVVDAQDAPIFGMVVVHATATLVPGHTKLYSSDVYGALGRLLRRRLGAGARVGVVVGHHGDSNAVPSHIPVRRLRQLRNKSWVNAGIKSGTTMAKHRRRRVAQRLTHLTARQLAEQIEPIVRKAIADATSRDQEQRVAVRFSEVFAPEATAELEPWDVVPGRGPSGSDLGQAGEEIDLPDAFMIGESVPAASEMNGPLDGKGGAKGGVVQKVLGVGGERPNLLEDGDHYRLPVKDPDDGHAPKAPPSSHFARWLANALTGGLITRPSSYDPHLPVRWIRIGHVNLIGVPAETSVELGHQIETAFVRAVSDDEVEDIDWTEDDVLVVTGNTGGYLGYGCTIPEYLVQSYEAASQYWGRGFGVVLRQRVADLVWVRPTANGQLPGQRIWDRATFTPKKPEGPGVPWDEDLREDDEDKGIIDGQRDKPGIWKSSRKLWPPDAELEPDGLLVLEGTWSPEAPPLAADHDVYTHAVARQAMVSLLARRPDEDALTPLAIDGLPVDDVHNEIMVWWEPEDHRWRFVVELPVDALPEGTEVDFRVGPTWARPDRVRWDPVRI